MIRINTKYINVSLSSFDLDDEVMKRVAAAVGVMLAMETNSKHLPFVVMNNYDILDGHNCTVSIGIDKSVP